MARKAPSVSLALGRALKTAAIRQQDAATVALARNYAEQIDADRNVTVKVGPLLLAALIELGMTPRSRAGVLAGTAGGGSANASPARRTKLDELREQRERARSNGTTPVDQAPS